MNDVRKPWTVTSMTEDGLVEVKFATVTEALAWIPNYKLEDGENIDPETQGYTHIAYEEPSEDFFAVMDDYALVYGRIVCKIVDGWAGGAGNYKLQLAGQWGNPPVEFWTPEGSTSDLGNDGVYGRNFPAPGASSDLILFSKEDL